LQSLFHLTDRSLSWKPMTAGAATQTKRMERTDGNTVQGNQRLAMPQRCAQSQED
jgi:hypothetical protein